MSSTSLPVPNRTEPFWLQERHPLANHISSPSLPDKADYVIIGSGISGATCAYFLFKELERNDQLADKKIVMLEADALCEGATARNGGHCKPLAFLGFRADAKRYGAEAANAALVFEASHLARYAAIVREQELDCDLYATRAFDIFFEEQDATQGRLDFEARQKLFPQAIEDADIRPVYDVEELRRLSGVKGGLWGAHYPAGHLWPYRFCTQLIQKHLSKGLSLYTYTPVENISSPSTGGHLIQTPRGTIQAKSIIITTNGYTAKILPELSEKIIPVRGTACSITPAPSHRIGSLPGPIRYTYGLRRRAGESDYMIPRQGRGLPGTGDQSIILGGAKGVFLGKTDEWYNNVREDQLMEGTREYFEGFMERRFDGWTRGHDQIDRLWTGILGYSTDLFPFIGSLPTRPSGIYLSAGFTGHGMPRIPGCSEAIVKLALAESSSSSAEKEAAQREFHAALPRPYLLTVERLEKKENLILGYMGATGTASVQTQSKGGALNSTDKGVARAHL